MRGSGRRPRDRAGRLGRRIIAHATQNKVPLDFVSTHVYGNDTAKDVFGDDRPIPPHQMVCAAVKKVHDQILASRVRRFR